MDYFAQLKDVTLSKRIAQLERTHGGLRKAAWAIKIDATYLLRLKSGEKKNPSAWTLRKLGLQRVVVYRSI